MHRIFLIACGVALAGCGEHPCTLSVGHPGFCGDLDDGSPAFCQEVCEVCDAGATKEAGCRAHCREVAGIGELECVELTDEVEAAYRDCVATLDYPGCGGG